MGTMPLTTVQLVHHQMFGHTRALAHTELRIHCMLTAMRVRLMIGDDLAAKVADNNVRLAHARK